MAAAKAKKRASPQRGAGHEQKCQQDAELRRGNGRARGGRNEFVHAQLLHDQARHAHAHARAQNGQQARQPGNQKDAHGLPIAREERSEIDVDHANE